MEIKDPEYGYYKEEDGVRKFLINAPEATPFWINVGQVKDLSVPIKVIKLLDFERRAICVRTDKIKFAWLYWALRYRIDKTAKYFKCFVVLSLGEWGAAFTPNFREAQWSDIGKKPKVEKP